MSGQMKFKQIAASTMVDADGFGKELLYGLGEDGRVYVYNDGIDPITHERVATTAYWKQMSNEVKPWT
jgi:hypothetical protein|tara:strand:- start:18217 stop:18420 length:204 start_codon:yes stop_codon:yes gene_type:complete